MKSFLKNIMYLSLVCFGVACHFITPELNIEEPPFGFDSLRFVSNKSVAFNTGTDLVEFQVKYGQEGSLIKEEVQIFRLSDHHRFDDFVYSTTKKGTVDFYATYQGFILDTISVNFIDYPNTEIQNKKVLLEQYINNAPQAMRSFYYGNVLKETNNRLILLRYFYQAGNPYYVDKAEQAYARYQANLPISNRPNGVFNRQISASWDLNTGLIFNEIYAPNFTLIKLETTITASGKAKVDYTLYFRTRFNAPLRVEVILARKENTYTTQNFLGDSLITNKYGTNTEATVNPYYIFLDSFTPIDHQNTDTQDYISIDKAVNPNVIIGTYEKDIVSYQNIEEKLYVLFLVRYDQTSLNQANELISIQDVKLGETLFYK